MWFAINAKPGCESRAFDLLRCVAKPAGLLELFVPQACVRTRDNAGCAELLAPMVPGLVVAHAPGTREMRLALRRARGIDELLAEAPSFTQMAEDEAALLLSFLGGPGARVAQPSEGRMLPGGHIEVDEGPLVGRERLVRKVSHRKKLAYLCLPMAGHELDAVVGLRLVSAREAVA